MKIDYRRECEQLKADFPELQFHGFSVPRPSIVTKENFKNAPGEAKPSFSECYGHFKHQFSPS